jgi:diguanylate cyclase (GGDEF)-like protein
MDAGNPRRELGLALGGRVDEVVELTDARIRRLPWVGKPASESYLTSRVAAEWVGTLMVARWLVSDIIPDDDESEWFSESGWAAAHEQLSIVNVVRGYLVWRDVVGETLVAEARRIECGRDVLSETLAVVRASCDANLIRAARAFDARLEEVSEQLERERSSLRYDALHDQLTGLPNRTLLYDRLMQACAGANRSGQSFAVLLVDLDGFKAINDSLGHRCGDLVLHDTAARLSGAVRGADTLGRFGGDEFVALLSGADERAARATAARVLERLAPPLTIAGQTVSVGASVGVAIYPADGQDVPSLLAAADRAMYEDKRERDARAAGSSASGR